MHEHERTYTNAVCFSKNEMSCQATLIIYQIETSDCMRFINIAFNLPHKYPIVTNIRSGLPIRT